MDIFEKQQVIQAVKMVVKGRWFLIGVILAQGLLITFFLEGVSVAPVWQLFIIGAAGYGYNFLYWLYLRRKPEDISDFGIKIAKGLQFFVDVFAISAILFVSGTTDKTVSVLYFVSLSICIVLYERRGVALAACCISFLFSALTFLEFYGFLPDPPIRGGIDFISAKHNLNQLLKQLVVFNSCIAAATLFFIFTGDLFRRREKNLLVQKDELFKKAALLRAQAGDLTRTKNWLHGSLVKSDKARLELQAVKEQLEKTNHELEKKIEELEKMSRLTTGRELKMVELKKEIEQLKQTKATDS